MMKTRRRLVEVVMKCTTLATNGVLQHVKGMRCHAFDVRSDSVSPRPARSKNFDLSRNSSVAFHAISGAALDCCLFSSTLSCAGSGILSLPMPHYLVSSCVLLYLFFFFEAYATRPLVTSASPPRNRTTHISSRLRHRCRFKHISAPLYATKRTKNTHRCAEGRS